MGVQATLSTYTFTIAIKITSNVGKTSTLIFINAVVSYFISIFKYD